MFQNKLLIETKNVHYFQYSFAVSTSKRLHITYYFLFDLYQYVTYIHVILYIDIIRLMVHFLLLQKQLW